MNAELELLDEDEALEGGQTVPMPASAAGVADLPRAERAVEELLSALGYSTLSEGLSATPRRVARCLAELLTARPYALTTFANEEVYDEMVVVWEIATYLNKALVPGGVAVVLEAEHLCMTIRGVAKPGARTVTLTLLGAFRDNAQTRREFLSVSGISGRPA